MTLKLQVGGGGGASGTSTRSVNGKGTQFDWCLLFMEG